jgi:hypothetical protein
VFAEHDFNSAYLAKDGHGAETSWRSFLERIGQNLGRRHLDPSVGAPKAPVDFNRPAWKPFAANFLSGRIDQNAENLFAARRNERFSPCRRS